MAGSLLLAMALLHFAYVFIPSIPLALSGCYGWLVLVWLLYKLPARQFIQFFALAGLGAILLVIAAMRGASISISELLTQNNALLVMLYGVSFLRLSALPRADTKQQLGIKSLIGNFFGIQALGAVINLSILVLVGEYFKSHQILKRPQITLMTRAFAIAAFWSPFFASMGVALTYAPNASLLGILSLGIGVAVVASLLSLLEFKYRMGNALHDFQGYPLKLNSLALPLGLALSIIVLHYLLPKVPILTLVALLAMIFSAALLIIKNLAVQQRFAEHVQAAPLRMARELALFLGAGVLTVGLKSVLSTFPEVSLFNQFTGLEAALSLGVAIMLALIGIHPLIAIALIGPMATPLVANPNVLGLLFLSIWSLGVVASPLSGMNVMVRGQLEIAGADLFRWHIGYVGVMWVLLSLLFTVLLG
ncbi:hypothetical protein [Thiofilum flexile]|uniref:hypothetical protein n=1 Tax=Thiofilum flexile TaxID=125627 RepID=UPI000377DE28|nr:hypothetical protein [Thiofilum flexile]